MKEDRDCDAILNELRTCENDAEKLSLFAELVVAPQVRVEHIVALLDSGELIATPAAPLLHQALKVPLQEGRVRIDRAFWEQELLSRGIPLDTDWRSLTKQRGQ